MAENQKVAAQNMDLDPADFEDDGRDELLKVSPALKILTRSVSWQLGITSRCS